MLPETQDWCKQQNDKSKAAIVLHMLWGKYGDVISSESPPNLEGAISLSSCTEQPNLP